MIDGTSTDPRSASPPTSDASPAEAAPTEAASTGPALDTAHALTTVRSFYRASTLRAGVFTDRFLGRGRPLGASRLIFEIGEEGAEVRALRARLHLDSGYLSRMLRTLEKEGLVAVVPLASDLRIRHARLTDDGLRELASLNRLGDAFAATTLEPLSVAERRRLVDAMAEVERLLRLSFTEITVEDPASRAAKWCLAQFARELDARLAEGFDVARSISADRRELTPPRGVFLVARLDGEAVGCGALKGVAPQVGSVKRMWVSRRVRGLGIGRRLLAALEAEAVGLGLTTLRLETNRSLHEALALYRRNGYREVTAFNDDPYADFWFEKAVGAADRHGPHAPA